MVVLLIGGIPDAIVDFELRESAKPDLIVAALYALVVAVGAAGGALVVKRVDVETSPKFGEHLRAHLSPDRIRLVDGLSSPEALAGATHAMLIGGGEKDVEVARAARDAGVRVFPVATTCAGSDRVCTEAVHERTWGLSQDELIVLMFENAYDKLFPWLLSP